MHSVKSTYATATDGSLGTTANNNVGLTQTNEVEGIGQSIGRRCASRSGGIVGPVQAIHNRDMSGSDVGNHLRDEEGVELRLFTKVLAIVSNFLFKGFDTADTHTVNHANAVTVFLFHVQTTIFNTLHSRDNGQLGIAVHLASLLTVDIVGHVEVLHLAGELAFEIGGVEMCDGCCATLTGQQVSPRLFGRVANGGNGSKTRHYYSF